MALTCNIGARGKALRFRIGIGLSVLAVPALGWALIHGGGLAWAAAALLLASSGFTLFEARAGWCALRALGVKTPL